MSEEMLTTPNLETALVAAPTASPPGDKYVLSLKFNKNTFMFLALTALLTVSVLQTIQISRLGGGFFSGRGAGAAPSNSSSPAVTGSGSDDLPAMVGGC